MSINIAKDFSKFPGPRYQTQGKKSGEEFRRLLLAPALKAAISSGDILTVNLDGTNGYGWSFLEEAFGGLIREEGFSKDEVKLVRLVSSEEPHWIEAIAGFYSATAVS